MKKPEEFPMPNPESSGVKGHPDRKSIRKLIEKHNRARYVMSANRLERAINSIDEKGLKVDIPPEDVDDPDQLTEDQRNAVEALNEEIEKILPKKNKHNK